MATEWLQGAVPVDTTTPGASDPAVVVRAVGPAAAAGTPPSVGTISSVNDAAASTTLLAANASRKGATFYNDSTVILYLAVSDTTASATAYTIQVGPGGYYELPVSQGGVYTGKVVGIWASDASGAVRVTELT